MPDTVILPMADALLDCLEIELLLNPDPPANFCLRAGDEVIHDVDGQSSLDKVCCPGTAYVRIGEVFPSSDGNLSPDTTVARGQGGCFPIAWAVVLYVGVIRCIPNMGTTVGPSCADWTTAATHDANDVDAIRRALCCWAVTLPKGRLWLPGTSTVQMQADCIERMMPVTVGIPRCC